MDFSCLTVGNNLSLDQALKKLKRTPYEILLVTKPNTKKLLGIVTFGDIRKALANLSRLTDPVASFMNKKPVWVKTGASMASIKRKLIEQHQSNKGNKLLILNGFGHVKDIAYLEYKDKKVKVNFFSKKPLKRQVVLVTGGIGYLGSVLVRLLLEKGYEVIVLDAAYFGDNSVVELSHNPNFVFIKGQIENINDLSRALQRADYVVHLAGIVGDPACGIDPLFTIDTNHFATQALVNMCKYYKISKLVFASSCSVYGAHKRLVSEKSRPKPISLYARSKLQSEKLLLKEQAVDFEVVILRLATLYGWSFRPRFDLVVNLFAGKSAVGDDIVVMGGNQWRPFLHVRDAARAIIQSIQAAKKQVNGEIFNVGSSEQNYTISEVAELVKSINPKVNLRRKRYRFDLRNYKVNFSKIRKRLAFEPQEDMIAGIEEIIAQVVKNKINIYDSKYSNYLQRLNQSNNYE